FLLQPVRSEVANQSACINTGGKDQKSPEQRRAVRLNKMTGSVLPPIEGLLSFVRDRTGGLVRGEGLEGWQNGNARNQCWMCHEPKNNQPDTNGKSEMFVPVEGPNKSGLRSVMRKGTLVSAMARRWFHVAGLSFALFASCRAPLPTDR